MCYEEAVVDINILVGDDNFGVEKSPKKNENWYATKRRERNRREVLGRGLGVGLWFHPLLGKWRVFFHPSLVRHAYKINWFCWTYILGSLFTTLLLFLQKRMAHILYLPILLVMRLFTFHGPFIIWNYFINFMSNKFNPPYIMPHFVFQMHYGAPLLPPWPTCCVGPWTWVTRLPYAH